MSSPHAPQPPRFTENQLRAALHSADGDGGPDPAALIGRARGIRARRRTGVLAAGLVAAVLAIGVGVLRGGDVDSRGDASRQESGSDVAGDSDSGGNGSSLDDPTAPTDPAGPSDIPSRMPVLPSSRPTVAAPLDSDRYADRPPLRDSGCPAQRDPLDAPAGAGSTGPLLGFAPSGAVACVYFVDGSVAAAPLSADRTADIVASLSAAAPLPADRVCTSDFGPAIRLLVAGAGGRTETIDAEAYGCGTVTNGEASRQGKAQVAVLLAALDAVLRPLG